MEPVARNKQFREESAEGLCSCVPPFAGIKSSTMYFLEVSEISLESWWFYPIILGAAVHKYRLPCRLIHQMQGKCWPLFDTWFFFPVKQLLNAFFCKTESHSLQKSHLKCWRSGSVTRSWNRFYCLSHYENMKIEIQFSLSKYWAQHLCFSCVWCQSLITLKSEGWVVIYKNKKNH